MSILFHSESIVFLLPKKRIIRSWIIEIIKKHDFKIGDINIIFTSNDYLLNINKTYLKHNYHTDVITFDYSSNDELSGDIFISVEQVRINSKEFDTIFLEELNRVIIHGILHLIGFNDTNEEERNIMTEKENWALHLLDSL